MAAIAASDVTNVQTWYEKTLGDKTLKHRIVTIALNGNGGTANDIPASTLGFEVIYGAQSLRYVFTADSSLHSVPVVVEADNEGILTINTENSTDNQRSDPANVTDAGALTVHVWGLDYQP